MIIVVIWVVLMLFWLFGGSYAYWPKGAVGGQAFAPFGANLIAWLCVAILGYVLFGGASMPGPAYYPK